MATELSKPSRLRLVKSNPVAAVAAQEDARNTGIILECVADTDCPHCGVTVPLTNIQPLSSLSCPACGHDFLVPGRVGGFLLRDCIGEGEMGAIYRATDESLNRDVAIKIVRGCHIDDPESRERLRLEACAAGRLNHPRVAQVYALGFSNGHPYLVMELVAGQDFAQKLQNEKRIDERTALRMALDVADGISALDREGLAHGDIKPGNIVLDRDGNAKLVDFGLSGMTRRNSRGAIVGTPHYIAPELLRGTPDTHRSDIYSLGATLYHLLSGRTLFEGETAADIIKARLFQQPAPLGMHARHISLPTQKLVMRMLEFMPAKRPVNSDAVAAAIRESLARLDMPKPARTGFRGYASRGFARFGRLFQTHPSPGSSRRHTIVALLLCLIAGIELLIAVRGPAFDQSLAWLRREVANRKKALVRLASHPQPQAAPPVQELFTTESSPVWKSTDLGASTQRGSTLQTGGGELCIQGAGTDMWYGRDSCRFVWTKITGNYEFSAKISAIARNDGLAVTGLLIKGEFPADKPGLLFGFLGSGEQFLHIRQTDDRTVVVKRSEQSIRVPGYLRIVRRGKMFEACVSVDGRSWSRFAFCELDLPARNTIGFAVSAQMPNTLATAEFAGIRLRTPAPPVNSP
jgi:serine/threonine protein kinase